MDSRPPDGALADQTPTLVAVCAGGGSGLYVGLLLNSCRMQLRFVMRLDVPGWCSHREASPNAWAGCSASHSRCHVMQPLVFTCSGPAPQPPGAGLAPAVPQQSV